MQELLYLVHRIPYPPNKGDKIRSYHLLKHLSQRYHIHLGTFIDDENDRKYLEKVRSLLQGNLFRQSLPEDSTHTQPLRPVFRAASHLALLPR